MRTKLLNCCCFLDLGAVPAGPWPRFKEDQRLGIDEFPSEPFGLFSERGLRIGNLQSGKLWNLSMDIICPLNERRID